MNLDSALLAFVNDMVADIEASPGGWRPRWAQVALPHNGTTQVAYQGMNVLMLWAAQARERYEHPVWATYKQWVSVGGQVRKGEHGVACVKWAVAKPKEGEDPTKRRLVPSAFTVFNVAQQDGATIEIRERRSDFEPMPLFEQLIAHHQPAIVEHSPCYMVGLDVIGMPERGDFHNDQAWAGTLAHELGHWTGHPSRLNRDLRNRFGSEAYAIEELIAELSAAMTCATLGLDAPEVRTDHAAYLKSWIAVLRAQPRIIMSIAQAAQRASTFLTAPIVTPVADDVVVDDDAAA